MRRGASLVAVLVGGLVVASAATLWALGPIGPVVGLAAGLWSASPGALVILAVLVAALSGPGDVERWLADRDVPVTRANVARAEAWLRTTRWWRAVGWSLPALAVLPATVLTNALAPADPARDRAVELVTSVPGWTLGIAGYGVGAIIAEVRRGGSGSRSTRRVADVRPRVLAAYANPLSLKLPRRLAVVNILVAVLVVSLGDVAAASIGLLTAATVAVVAIVEVVRRWVVGRSQHAPDEEMLVLDDAARTTTVHAVSGTAIALLSFALAGLLNALSGTGPGGWPAVVAFLVAVGGAGIWLGHGVGLVHVVKRGRRHSDDVTSDPAGSRRTAQR